MNELELTLEGIDPAVFWGANNQNFNRLKHHFPKLKIVARGAGIKVYGEEAEMLAFQSKLDHLIQWYDKYGSLSEERVGEVLGHSPVAGPDESQEFKDVIVFGTDGKVIRARSANQKRMVTSAQKNDIIFALGPAGTGKTYTAVALAVRALKNKEVRRIVLTRPAVEAGESLGFLPGDLKEKIDPYLRPLYDALDDMIPPQKLKFLLENGTIEIAPLAFMRGRTLDHAFVILDEAQNTTDSQLKMFLTRMGPDAKFILTGDTTQVDLPERQRSGLPRAAAILKEIPGIDIIELDGSDVVRHRLVREIISAYETEIVPEREMGRDPGKKQSGSAAARKS